MIKFSSFHFLFLFVFTFFHFTYGMYLQNGTTNLPDPGNRTELVPLIVLMVEQNQPFWVNCSFKYDKVPTPWTLTLKKMGNEPLEVFKFTSGSPAAYVPPVNVSGIEVNTEKSTHEHVQISKATDKSIGDYECELVDGKAAVHNMKVKVGYKDKKVPIAPVKSSAIRWIPIKFNLIHLIAFNSFIYFIFS